MPIATFEQYKEMLTNARSGKFAYPAINITSLESISACLEAFAEAKTDGIIQVSSGGGKHASGGIGDMAFGAIVLAEATHRMAAKYDILIALHTDHCSEPNLVPFMDPLLEESEKRVANGQLPLFNSHMFDGCELPLSENLEISKKYLKRCAKLNIILEIETGIVGGEEDGHDTSNVAAEKLYTTPEDMVESFETLQPLGTFMLAATFGNVHGVYKPGNVKLTPTILRDGQAAVKAKHGTDDNPLFLVFHGGSGSSKEEIAETLEYGVIKMNVDTDTQYAFTRPIVDHMFKNYDGMLKIEGEVGNKKVYDPRSYLKAARNGMKERVLQACKDLNAVGKSLTLK